MLGLVFRRRPLLTLFQLPCRYRLGHCKNLLSRTSPHHPAPPSVAWVVVSIFSIFHKRWKTGPPDRKMKMPSIFRKGARSAPYLMKSAGGRAGNFLQLGVKGGVWKKTRLGTAMVVDKHFHPPLLRVCWVLAIEWNCVWDVKVHGCVCAFDRASGSDGPWGLCGCVHTHTSAHPRY